MVETSHTAGWFPNHYEPLRHLGERVADWFAPKSEASASADVYRIDMELPGVSADDIDISVEENSLTVRGEKRSEREVEGRSHFFSEREYGAFQRSFRLPQDADPEGAAADFDNSVLAITVPKLRESASTARKIEIGTAK